MIKAMESIKDKNLLVEMMYNTNQTGVNLSYSEIVNKLGLKSTSSIVSISGKIIMEKIVNNLCKEVEPRFLQALKEVIPSNIVYFKCNTTAIDDVMYITIYKAPCTKGILKMTNKKALVFQDDIKIEYDPEVLKLTIAKCADGISCFMGHIKPEFKVNVFLNYYEFNNNEILQHEKTIKTITSLKTFKTDMESIFKKEFSSTKNIFKSSVKIAPICKWENSIDRTIENRILNRIAESALKDNSKELTIKVVSENIEL